MNRMVLYGFQSLI